MTLSTFITNTLLDIHDGIHQANDELNKRKGKILGKDGCVLFCLKPNRDDREEGFIMFDVAVSATQESSEAASGGIKVVIADIGGKLSSATTQEQVSRIKFHVIPGVYIA